MPVQGTINEIVVNVVDKGAGAVITAEVTVQLLNQPFTMKLGPSDLTLTDQQKAGVAAVIDGIRAHIVTEVTGSRIISRA